jgi:hypothetical protein
VNGFSLFFHIRKTFKLASAVLHDPRVHWAPKLAFIVSAGALGLAVLVPELGMDSIMAVIPGFGWLGDALGIPAEATFDWVTAAVAAYNLLKLFPAEIVGEHYDRLFRSRRRPRAA